jgi:hypothetical protein
MGYAFSGARNAVANWEALPLMVRVMKWVLLIVCAVGLVGCQTGQPIVFAGGDGSSRQQAVVISGAPYRETSLLTEKMWLERRYPGYGKTKESSLDSAGKHYDVFEVTTADGQAAVVYFDTTESVAK